MTEPSSPSKPSGDSPQQAPGVESIFQFLTYSLSLPERAVRGTTALVSGLVGESARLIIPQAFQNSRTYKTFVSQMIDFLARDVGGVQRPGDPAPDAERPSGSEPQVENFVARKVVGNFVELAGLATLHLSPLTLLAVVSDVAYGSKVYLQELAAELRKQGVIDERSTINGVQDLLDAIGNATSSTAQSLDLPPLTVEEIRKSLSQTVDAVGKIDVTRVLPQAEIERLWQDMKTVGEQQNVGLFQLGSAMAMYSLNQITNVGKGALASAQVAGGLFDRQILEHYRTSLGNIANKGFYQFIADSSRPYIDAIWTNFSANKQTVTEDLLTGRLPVRFWSSVRGFFKGKSPESSPTEPPEDRT
jgi:hypothetical protein